MSVALLALATALLAALDHMISPKSWDWVHSGKLQGSLAICLGVLAFIDYCRSVIVEGNEAKRLGMEAKIRSELGALIVTLSEVLGVSAGDIGAGVYLPRHHMIGRPRSLHRVVRHRLIQKVQPSTVKWDYSKGAVGECWKQESLQHGSWRGINGRYVANKPSEAAWVGLPEKTKRGFTYRDWCQMLGRYLEVLAVPMVDGDELLGVVAVDLRGDESEYDRVDVLNNRAIKAAINVIADKIKSHLA